MELWFFLAFVPAIFWAMINIFDKVFIDRYLKDVFSFTFFTNILSPILLIVLIIVFGFEIVGIYYVLLAFLAAFGYIFTNIFYARALGLEEASKVIPLFSLTVIFTVIYDFFIFSEAISLFWLLSICLIVFWVFALVSDKLSLKIFKPRRVLFLMFFASFSYSITLLTAKLFLESYSFYVFITYQVFFQIIICLSYLFFKPIRKKLARTMEGIGKKRVYLLMWVNQVLDSTALFVMQFTLSIWVSSYVFAVSMTQYIFVLLFTTFFTLLFPKILKEELDKKIFAKKSVSIIMIIVWVIMVELLG